MRGAVSTVVSVALLVLSGCGAHDLGTEDADLVTTSDGNASSDLVRADAGEVSDAAPNAPLDVSADASADAGEDADASVFDAVVDAFDCAAPCGAAECGPDPLGCGVSCGSCGERQHCEDGVCLCAQDAVRCGTDCCATGETCTPDSGCCRPDCSGRACGTDGCGGSCGECSLPGESCTAEGRCRPLVCGEIECPGHPDDGWGVSCNEQGFCEYTREPGASEKAEVFLPAGSFTMGLPEGACPFPEMDALRETCGNAQPAHVVSFERGYFIGKYEVTIGAYRSCIADGACPDFDGSGDYCWHSWDDQGNNVYVFDVLSDDRPAVCVGFEGAKRFCAWVGARLPSEAEWEYALRLDSDALYLWSGPAPDLCGEVACCDCLSEVAAVGTMPGDVSAAGLRDMLGNVSEYVADCWSPSYEGVPGNGSPRTVDCDPVWPHTTRGGAIRSRPEALYTMGRSWAGSAAHGSIGFRCVRGSASRDHVAPPADRSAR